MCPIEEREELYEVDVMVDNILVRTLRKNKPRVQYTIKNQNKDFKKLQNLPESFTATIYQISDYVGRGYPKTLKIEFAKP